MLKETGPSDKDTVQMFSLMLNSRRDFVCSLKINKKIVNGKIKTTKLRDSRGQVSTEETGRQKGEERTRTDIGGRELRERTLFVL